MHMLLPYIESDGRRQQQQQPGAGRGKGELQRSTPENRWISSTSLPGARGKSVVERASRASMAASLAPRTLAKS